ncbi:MAG: hypothetical protein ABIT08_06855 [Bacteroidia bacterium]
MESIDYTNDRWSFFEETHLTHLKPLSRKFLRDFIFESTYILTFKEEISLINESIKYELNDAKIKELEEIKLSMLLSREENLNRIGLTETKDVPNEDINNPDIKDFIYEARKLREKIEGKYKYIEDADFYEKQRYNYEPQKIILNLLEKYDYYKQYVSSNDFENSTEILFRIDFLDEHQIAQYQIKLKFDLFQLNKKDVKCNNVHEAFNLIGENFLNYCGVFEVRYMQTIPCLTENEFKKLYLGDKKIVSYEHVKHGRKSHLAFSVKNCDLLQYCNSGRFETKFKDSNDIDFKLYLYHSGFLIFRCETINELYEYEITFVPYRYVPIGQIIYNALTKFDFSLIYPIIEDDLDGQFLSNEYDEKNGFINIQISGSDINQTESKNFIKYRIFDITINLNDNCSVIIKENKSSPKNIKTSSFERYDYEPDNYPDVDYDYRDDLNRDIENGEIGRLSNLL